MNRVMGDTLEYEITVPSRINVPPGKFGKNNNSTAWSNSTPWKSGLREKYVILIMSAEFNS